MSDITLLSGAIIQGEGRWVKFTYTDENGVAISMPATGYTFIVKASEGAVATLFTATEFDVTNRTSGIIRVNIPASETADFAAGWLYGQMTAVITADTDVDIQKIKFKVEADL